MIIISPASTGKTMLGCVALNEYAIGGSSATGGVVVGYTTLEEMARRVIDASRNRANETHIMEAYTTPDMLFIDDVHGIRESVQSILFRVIDSRYLQQKGLIMASSMAHAVLREILGERIGSRLNHMKAFACSVKKEDFFRLCSNAKPWYKKGAISSSNVRGFPPPAQTGSGEAC
jgi:DNA replication protein DnaC